MWALLLVLGGSVVGVGAGPDADGAVDVGAGAGSVD